MTKDFKQQIAADSSFGQYGLSWMLGGIGIGLLVGLGMYAIANKGDPSTTTTATVATATTANSASVTPNATSRDNPNAGEGDTTATSDNNSANPPGFSYHAVLPQLEVDVPITVHEDAAPKAAAPKKPEPTAAVTTPTTETKPNTLPTGFNGLQIGSYKTEEQAAAMQARLKHSGLNSQSVKATVHGETWFRVRVGPASDAATLNKWQQTLSGMGISALPVRM